MAISLNESFLSKGRKAYGRDPNVLRLSHRKLKTTLLRDGRVFSCRLDTTRISGRRYKIYTYPHPLFWIPVTLSPILNPPLRPPRGQGCEAESQWEEDFILVKIFTIRMADAEAFTRIGCRSHQWKAFSTSIMSMKRLYYLPNTMAFIRFRLATFSRGFIGSPLFVLDPRPARLSNNSSLFPPARSAIPQ